MKQLGFLYNVDLCIGCKACEAACINENKTSREIKWRRVSQPSADSFLSISCNHCDSPECFRVCPQKAYTKRRDGIVIIDSDRCDGCMTCVSACPFHAPQFDQEKRKASKCILCYPRLQDNLAPACVEACPTDAIQIIDFNQRIPKDSVPSVSGFPDNILLTKPSVRFYPTEPRKRYWIKQ